MSSLDLHFEDPDESDDHTIRVHSIIEKYLQPNTAATLQQTSASLLAILPKNKPTSTDVYTVGTVCIDLGERIPYYHPLQLKLVGLLEYLQLSPHLCQIVEVRDLKHHKPTGEFVQHTLFAEAMLDNMSITPDPEHPGHFVNFHCFAANLCERQILSGDATWAIWALRYAHEEICKEEGEWRQFTRDERIMAAAQWILWFGQSLFKQVLFPGEVDPEDLTHSWRPGPLYQGPGGLSIDRWRFWKKGFASVAAGAEGEKKWFGEECVRLSSKAAEIMESLEESMTF